MPEDRPPTYKQIEDVKKVVYTKEFWWIVAYGSIGVSAGLVDCLTLDNSSDKVAWSSSSNLHGCHQAIFNMWAWMLAVPVVISILDGGLYVYNVHHAENSVKSKRRVGEVRVALELLGVLFYGIALIVTLTYFYNGVGSGSCSTSLRQSMPPGLTSQHGLYVVEFSLAHVLMIVAASMMFINAIRLLARALDVQFEKAIHFNLLGS